MPRRARLPVNFFVRYFCAELITSPHGVDNLFDIRHYRAGNAQTTGNSTTGAYLYGAGAETYNESGRTFYVSVNTHF